MVPHGHGPPFKKSDIFDFCDLCKEAEEAVDHICITWYGASRA